MDKQRRTFLKGAGTVAIAGAAGILNSTETMAQSARSADPAGGRVQEMPKKMTFVTLRYGDDKRNEWGLGIKTERGILDVRKAEAMFRQQAPTAIDDVLHGRGDNAGLQRLVEKAQADKDSKALFVNEAQAQLGPCVTNPQKIICIGLNYRKHAAETGQPVPTVPILFNKYNNALFHHGGVIKVSQVPAEKFDHEVELVIVMGKTARNVSEADALSYVFGYCTGNDFTARDLQSRTNQWMLGKTCDQFGPIGPYLVTADQIPDPNNLKLECRVNGQIHQSSNTSDMVFNCASLISYISRHFTLSPGDIIFTGTPEGVIAGLPKEKQVWLKPGDQLTTTIEKLGALQFTLA
jgi:2-keto-4-pentenoate hydratase/2-oxohepta-3-ene-1,7-dioic acid hydratase in catechol pathway